MKAETKLKIKQEAKKWAIAYLQVLTGLLIFVGYMELRLAGS